jgi:hypothetical protein
MGDTVNSVTFELERYPLVVLRMPQRGSVEQVHAWYDHVERLLRDASAPLALVHDLRRLDLMSVTARHRAAVAERSLALKGAHLADRIGADARIVTNPVVAGAVNVVSWLTGATPWPQATFTNEGEAVDWARRTLGGASGSARPHT